ncbi:MAG: 3-isopropylmalate dehydratase small subunit [Chloroflexi bacterium]|nr:MAG: 3-isopropylmalate dehydratase small subunit [Chloroflexota bacterium]
MKALRVHQGRMAPLDRDNVDTDQIIPKQFLRRVERSGFGPFLFYDWRREDPDFVLDRPQYRGASVLVAGVNFGCGSSREHAPWAIEDAGFRVVIAPSFADIFRSNCGKVGILALALPEGRVRQLMEVASEAPDTELTVDLEKQLVSAPGFECGFEVDPFTRECLLNGWDEVALTLRHQDAIAAYEEGRSSVQNGSTPPGSRLQSQHS